MKNLKKNSELCFTLYQSFPHKIKGGLVADAVTLLGSMNIIAGELDR